MPALMKECATANPAPKLCSRLQRRSVQKAAVGIARRQTVILLSRFRPHAQKLFRHRCMLQLPFLPRMGRNSVALYYLWALVSGLRSAAMLLQNPLLARATVNSAPLPQASALLATCCSFCRGVELLGSCICWFALSVLVGCATHIHTFWSQVPTRWRLGQAEVRAKAPRRPGKVPLEKGYSQMDWLRLCRTHPDLAGVRGTGLLLCVLFY